MSAGVFYDSASEIALLSNTFQSSGVSADPDTVSCVVTDPSGIVATHIYGGAGQLADVQKSVPGTYTLSVPCQPSTTGVDGLWSYVWIGTGAVSDVQPGTWRVLPVSLSTWYIGMEELKSRLGITGTTDDYELQIAIQATCNWINEHTGRHFYRLTETRTFQPEDIWHLDIDDVVSITAFNVDTDGDGIFEQPWIQNVDYQLLIGDRRYNVNAAGVQRPYRTIRVIQTGKWFPFTWPYSHQDRIQITGIWGWPSVPPDISQAALIIAADLFKFKDAPFGVAGVSDIGVVRVQPNPWISELLQRYIDPRRKVGV